MSDDHRRADDRGWLCTLALRFSQLWDFVDRRQIDCWVVTIFTLTVTYRLTEWGVQFASHSPRPGIEVAAIIGAVGAPWALLQAAVVKFVFDARQKSFEGNGK